MIVAHVADSDVGSTLLVTGVAVALWGWRQRRGRMAAGGLLTGAVGLVVGLLHGR